MVVKQLQYLSNECDFSYQIFIYKEISNNSMLIKVNTISNDVSFLIK